MRVEAGSEGTMGEERDEFPIGMRVLAVDDNLTCLKILEAKLRICRYNVTTTNQAIEALKMLREDRDKFDLIITDVHMPDMDGYKLLELVGLEMDLPVIMLSADGDDKAVMKGITHGACDYLLKPVRIEELKNIWQHVIRKKSSALREHSNSDNATSESSGHMVSRKRKEQNEDEDDDDEENMNKAENMSQKKQRTVWTQELHQKFVKAMMDLGPAKAVPKRILEHMNVEGLTRENVASHLQKYRLYLKKVESQAVNVAAALGRRDCYLPLAAVDNFGDFHSFTSSSQVPALTCFPHNGAHIQKDSNVLGHNNVSHKMLQEARTNNVSNTINNLAKFQHGNLMQRMPANFEVNPMQQQKRMIHEPNGPFVNPLPFHARQTSLGLSSTCLGSYEMNSGVSYNNTWQSAFPTISSGTPVVSQINCNPLYCSSSGTLVAPASNPMIGNTMQMVKGNTDDSKYLNFGNVGNTQRQWRDANQDLTHEPNIAFSSFVDPPLASNSIVDSIPLGQRLNSGMRNNRIIMNANGQTDGNMLLPEQCNIGRSIADGKLKYKDEYFLENPTIQEGLSSTGHGFDDLFNMY